MTPTPHITVHGKIRVYFNRHKDAPRVWCISDLERRWELQLAHVTLACPMETVYEPLVPTTKDHDGPPTAYLVSAGEVVVEVTGDRARVRAPDWLDHMKEVKDTTHG